MSSSHDRPPGVPLTHGRPLGPFWSRVVRRWRVLGRLQRAARAARTKVRELRTGYRGLPDNVNICVSQYCNFECRMCPFSAVHGNQQHMSMETLERLLPLIAVTKKAHFTGFGDPAFNRQLVPFIRRIRESVPTAEVELTTNGSMLTEKLSRLLIANSLTRLVIPIDGARKETVEAIRIGLDFPRLLDSIRTLQALKAAAGARYPLLRINFSVGYDNYFEIVESVELARELGAEEISYIEMQPATEEEFRGNLLNSLDKDGGALLKEALTRLQRYGIRYKLQSWPDDHCPVVKVPHVAEDGEVFPCYYLTYGRSIYADGKVLKFPSVSFGNLNQTDFKSLWNSPDYRTFRENCLSGKFTDYCQHCHNSRTVSGRKLKQVLWGA